MQILGGNLTIITGQKRILFNYHYAIITPSVINITSRVVREQLSLRRENDHLRQLLLRRQKGKRQTVTQRIGDALYFNFFLEQINLQTPPLQSGHCQLEQPACWCNVKYVHVMHFTVMVFLIIIVC